MHGVFPFGRPNTEGPTRRPSGDTTVLAVGVHPSAFFVSWWAHDEERPQATIGALAVDVEPVPSWDGTTPTPVQVLDHWKANVNFDDRWGRVATTRDPPLGRRLLSAHIEPLGATAATTAHLYLVPWFLVEGGNWMQPGEFIRKKFQPWAIAYGAPQSTLPTRPTSKDLSAFIRISGRRDQLREQILNIRPRAILALGQGALDGLHEVCDDFTPSQARLARDARYGRLGSCSIDGVNFGLLATIHPGAQGIPAAWGPFHRRWMEITRAERPLGN